MLIEKIASFIKKVPDFPKPGIIFRDITPLLKHPYGLNWIVKAITEELTKSSLQPTIIVGPESRGFILGVALAKHLSIGFIPIRKAGKLPRTVYQCTYELEYGNDTLEIHADDLSKSDQVLLIDDLLATGGTALACCELINKRSNLIGAIFLIELLNMQGRKKLLNIPIKTIIQYE